MSKPRQVGGHPTRPATEGPPGAVRQPDEETSVMANVMGTF